MQDEDDDMWDDEDESGGEDDESEGGTENESIEGDDVGGHEDRQVEETSIKRKRKKGPTYADASAFAHILEDAADENEGVNPRLAEWEQGRRGKRKR